MKKRVYLINDSDLIFQILDTVIGRIIYYPGDMPNITDFEVDIWDFEELQNDVVWC